jgi:hypothetical protein
MIMPKFPDTVMPTIYHIETGAFQTYSIDAREMLTSYPEVYKTEPWTEKEKVEFAKRSKADPVKKETPKWVVKEPISLGGTLQNTTGQILENYLNEPNERIVPLNDACWHARQKLCASCQGDPRQDGSCQTSTRFGNLTAPVQPTHITDDGENSPRAGAALMADLLTLTISQPANTSILGDTQYSERTSLAQALHDLADSIGSLGPAAAGGSINVPVIARDKDKTVLAIAAVYSSNIAWT